MAYCKGQCCGKTKGCQCKEYCGKACGAIRPGEPKCPPQAVIPSLTVESVSNLKDLADCFVHVSDINTTFYIDDKHRMMTTWAGPVEYNNYDLDANSLGLRSQFLIDFANERGAYYDKTGDYKVFNFGDSGGEENEVYTITVTGGQGVGTYATENWQIDAQSRITALLSYHSSQASSEFEITKKDGSEASISAMANDLEALAEAEYKFSVAIPLSNRLDIIAKPTNVLQGQNNCVIVSGTYALDETFLTDEPDSLLFPPLRWKLVLFPDTDAASFLAEMVVKLL